MPQTFPFTNPDPGWADGQKLYASQMITVAANAAQAADGLLWSDVAIVKNFSSKTTIANAGNAIFWDAYLRRWITAGATGGAPVALASADGRDEWVSLTVPAGTNWNLTASGESNGIGSMVIGGGGGVATASKIRQSADGGDTWTARSTIASSTEAVNGLKWFSGPSLFVACLSSAVSTNIETSPDGITWTQRTAPNSEQRRMLAASATAIVCTANVASNKAIYSANGTSWAESTLPATSTWAVEWDPLTAKFVALAPGLIATSSDGATWSTSGLVAPYPVAPGTAGRMCFLRRMWIATGSRDASNFSINVSIDSGASWKVVKTIPSIGGRIATGDSQIVYVNSTSQAAYATIRGGL